MKPLGFIGGLRKRKKITRNAFERNCKRARVESVGRALNFPEEKGGKRSPSLPLAKKTI